MINHVVDRVDVVMGVDATVFLRGVSFGGDMVSLCAVRRGKHHAL